MVGEVMSFDGNFFIFDVDMIAGRAGARGYVVCPVGATEEYYLLQQLSWLDGGMTSRKIVHIKDLLSAEFFAREDGDSYHDTCRRILRRGEEVAREAERLARQ